MKNMNPSELIAEGQIGKICELLSARLRKTKLPKEPFQRVLEKQGPALISKMLMNITEMIDLVENMVTQHVRVDKEMTFDELLFTAKRKQVLLLDPDVITTIPKHRDKETDVYFFNFEHKISDNELEKEYELRGLKPAHPYSLALVNIQDPLFEVIFPNGTHWKDEKGKWCFAAFSKRTDGKSVVEVGNKNVNSWGDCWWYAGVYK